MLQITTYRFKPFLTKAETTELMGVFMEFGTPPNTLAHYVFADGGGGLVITDFDDPADGYRNILHYTQWVEYQTQPLMSIEQAVPLINEALS